MEEEKINDTSSSGHQLGPPVFILTGALSITVLVFTVLGIVCLRKYRSLVRTIRELRGSRLLMTAVPRLETLIAPAVVEEEDQLTQIPQIPQQQSRTIRLSSRRLWRSLQQGPRVTKSDLNLLQLIKAGKEGVFYQARMTRGTCKGHSMFTCKISKEGVRPKHVDTEVSIMRKLVHHKNILQLLDWNTTEEPYILIMEYVTYGTLRTFLQTNRAHLSEDPELQSLLTIASYHIALALQHLRSKMIVHCDLALRNIMVNKFPWEVKVAEFGLARDLTRMTSRRSSSSRWRNPRQRVPLRWYPPEYFKNNYYSFKGDVWAFGIVLWEMQTFGTLPYPNLETSEAVMYHICIGHKNTNPEGCRPEILHIMKDCWLEPYTLRPSFTDIVRMLENIMESDADYVDVESPLLLKEEAEYHEA
ncbi:tyrosine kinase receptor Cad96Ca isoform X1 [Trematomus bernacchii]|uniref:tyrosine kinase receptor Cad96Ca isoform X1 n=1 Tax=Trematomus bernacchii TaxID=40690 RepID=UPI001469F6B8|nr:tyrosine kinase receptor Cad96Ca isoform X1 [Trematomus bernacchii]XP_033969118.1 tyrosine kinase receptor Cad96Ca isoform X1 [Trematomus bernacchii]XP_033969119.1 tyrosine kinase receptor Cad96Ca isoform X1 [Trematomus bernacchii]